MDEESRKTGRPTELTPDMEARITQLLRAGNYIETAAAMAGLSKVSLYKWLKRGARERGRLEKSPKAKPRKQEAPYLSFVNAVEKAQAHAEVVDVAAITAGARGSWQAAAWRLERKFPARWGRKDHIKVEMEREVESFISELRGALDPATFQVVSDAVANLVAHREDGPEGLCGGTPAHGGDPEMDEGV